MKHICNNCNVEFKRSSNNARFCSKSCSAIFNNKNRKKCINQYNKKPVNCIKCGVIELINIRSSCKKFKCSTCKENKSKKQCKYCGVVNCDKSDICKNYLLIPTLKKYFNFDINLIGTINSKIEYNNIRKILDYQYNVLGYSIPDLCKLYSHPDHRNFNKILNSLKIPKRSISDSQKTALLNGKKINVECTNQYKSGWHSTWTGEKIYYRSSYELEYAIQLDNQHINYEVEKLRIEYWDTQKCSYRVAIPDFYLPSSNIIVEIKSNWTYDEQNMKDKFKRYQELGYNAHCLLEKNIVLAVIV